MKTKLLTILLFMVCGLVRSQDTTLTYFNSDWEKCKKGEHTYYGKTFQISDSLWGKIDYFKSGQVQMTGFYKTRQMNKRHGEFVFYKANGDTSKISDFVNGEEEGRFIEFFDNGNINVRTSIINGFQEGKTYYYHKNGVLSSEGMFHKGIRVGEWKYYDNNGKYIASEHFIQNYKSPAALYKLTIPEGWIHVSKEQYGSVVQGISTDRIFRKSVWSAKGEEQFFSLDAIGFKREDLTADQVCINMAKGAKVKYKKIKDYRNWGIKFDGVIYRYFQKMDNGKKLEILLFALKQDDRIMQLKFTFNSKVDEKVLKEIKSIVESGKWE